MKNLLASTLIPGVLALIGVVALVLWTNVGPVGPLEARVPGLDRPKAAEGPARAEAAGRQADEVRRPRRRPCPALGRGSGRSGSTASPSRACRWPGSGRPPARRCSGRSTWAKATPGPPCGTAACLCSITTATPRPTPCAASRWPTGKEIWRFSYPVAVKRNHGMSRTVPAVTDKYLVALGPKCHVSCLDPTTGKAYWLIDLVRQFGATVPPWYAGQCPLDRRRSGDPCHRRRRRCWWPSIARPAEWCGRAPTRGPGR